MPTLLQGLAAALAWAEQCPHIGLGLATETCWLLTHLLTSEDPINRAVAAGVLTPLLKLLQAASGEVRKVCIQFQEF